MDMKTKEIYSEVYSILNILGDSYIANIPSSLYKIIKEERLNEYDPHYDSNIALEQQNIRREAISMIALFHLNYWCNSPEEKQELKELFKDNEVEYQEKLREKYNPDNLFENRNQNITEEKDIPKTGAIVKYKESIFKKIINKIKNIFKR